MRYAILIDGGFIKKKLGSQEQPLTAKVVSEFLKSLRSHEALKTNTLHRVYWYDAPPLTDKIRKPLNGGTLDLGRSALAEANTALFASLRNEPYFSLRSGEVVHRGWKVKADVLPENQAEARITADDIVPNIQQKGVDMRLGLDIASLTLKSHADIIVLVTGDSDFVPALKFARREGAQIFLVPLGHHLRPEMTEHSDLIINIFDLGFEKPTRRPAKRP